MLRVALVAATSQSACKKGEIQAMTFIEWIRCLWKSHVCMDFADTGHPVECFNCNQYSCTGCPLAPKNFHGRRYYRGKGK